MAAGPLERHLVVSGRALGRGLEDDGNVTHVKGCGSEMTVYEKKEAEAG